MSPHLVLLLGLVACSPSIAVETAQSPTAHFDRYRTYAFEHAGAPSGFAGSPHSAYVKVRLESLTESVLESKRYVPFVIEILDTTTRGVLWQGSARLEVEPNTVDEKRLQRAATEVLATMPAR